MGLHLVGLDEITRNFMLDEIRRDLQDGSMYFGKYLSAEGVRVWPDLTGILDRAD